MFRESVTIGTIHNSLNVEQLAALLACVVFGWGCLKAAAAVARKYVWFPNTELMRIKKKDLQTEEVQEQVRKLMEPILQSTAQTAIEHTVQESVVPKMNDMASELKNNHGSSFKDFVEQRLDAQDKSVDLLRQDIFEVRHKANHMGERVDKIYDILLNGKGDAPD